MFGNWCGECKKVAWMPRTITPSVVLQPVLMSTGHTPMYTSAVSTLVRPRRFVSLRQCQTLPASSSPTLMKSWFFFVRLLFKTPCVPFVVHCNPFRHIHGVMNLFHCLSVFRLSVSECFVKSSKKSFKSPSFILMLKMQLRFLWQDSTRAQKPTLQVESWVLINEPGKMKPSPTCLSLFHVEDFLQQQVFIFKFCFLQDTQEPAGVSVRLHRVALITLKRRLWLI